MKRKETLALFFELQMLINTVAFLKQIAIHFLTHVQRGAQWLSGRVLDSRTKGRGFEPHRRHCVVSLSKNINPSLVLVQPRKTCPFITERLLMGRKESNQTNKQNKHMCRYSVIYLLVGDKMAPTFNTKF